jgi:hypothetical protein
LNSGIAGYVATGSHSLFVEKLKEDSRFSAEVDDPNGK